MEQVTLDRARATFWKVLTPLVEDGFFDSFRDLQENQAHEKFYQVVVKSLVGENWELFFDFEADNNNFINVGQELYFIAGYVLASGRLDLLEEAVKVVVSEKLEYDKKYAITAGQMLA